MSLLSADGGKKIVELDTAGNVIIRNSRTGAVEREVDGPINPAGADFNSQYLAAADPEARYAAVLVPIPADGDLSAVDVVDVATGAITRIPGGGAAGVGYAGENLLVQRDDGSLEVRSADGRQLIRSFAGDPNTTVGPVGTSDGFAVEANSDGAASVFDLSSGQQIGSIALPAGSRDLSIGIAFTPSGTDLISATADTGLSGTKTGTVTEWSFSPAQWTTAACAAAGHTLTAAEWRQYVGANGPALPSHLAC